jgi:hypothetical protein
MVARNKAPIFLVLGVAMLIGAGVLAWFSSVAVLALARTGPMSFSAEFQSRLLGVLTIGSDRIDDIRSASMEPSREPGSRSRTPDRLVFTTPRGPVDRGYEQQLFARDFAAIDAFFKDPAQASLRLVSTGSGSEAFRFLFAQLSVAALGALGALLLGIGVRGLKDDPTAIRR